MMKLLLSLPILAIAFTAPIESRILIAHGDHKKIEVPQNQPQPTVKLSVTKDALRGWNLQIATTNFRSAPEKIATKSTATNEGHAHLYINGKKVTRLYGNWYYINNLKQGRNQIKVTLNTNSHADIMVNGKPVMAMAEVIVP